MGIDSDVRGVQQRGFGFARLQATHLNLHCTADEHGCRYANEHTPLAKIGSKTVNDLCTGAQTELFLTSTMLAIYERWHPIAYNHSQTPLGDAAGRWPQS
jgi:hypothetical protein